MMVVMVSKKLCEVDVRQYVDIMYEYGRVCVEQVDSMSYSTTCVEQLLSLVGYEDVGIPGARVDEVYYFVGEVMDIDNDTGSPMAYEPFDVDFEQSTSVDFY